MYQDWWINVHQKNNQKLLLEIVIHGSTKNCKALKDQFGIGKEYSTKYKQDHQWHAYKEHYNKYTKFLRTPRMMYTLNEITKFKGISKHLYKLIAELTGSKVENPLPEGLSDEDLAEHFANVFIAKIENIRNKLNNYPQYIWTETCTVGNLSKFKLLSADEIGNLVGKMQMKSCELDYLLTHIFKNHIDTFILVLTKIVNLTLKMVCF